MSRHKPPSFARRSILQAGIGAGLLSLLGRAAGAAQPGDDRSISRPIPATGERLPVMGLGTNAFSLAQADALRALLARFSDLGATLIDTAAMYGESEAVLGQLIEALGLRHKLFLATKLSAGEMRMGPPPGMGPPPNASPPVYGRDSFERSLQRLRTDHIDLLQVHNLNGVDTLMADLLAWKKAGRVRYIGITTSDVRQHAETAEHIRRYPLDFVQVDYSIANRDAASTVLPVAAQRRVAVIVNMPLGGRGGRNLLAGLKDRPLPVFAADIGARSWSQLLLKYAASHPAVTAVIAGSTRLDHLEDNLQAGRGAWPDAAFRKRVEDYWDQHGA